MNSAPAGIDFEINLELFKRLGIDVSYETFPWTRQLAYAEKGLSAGILTVYCEDKRPFLEIVEEPFYEVKISLFTKQKKHEEIKIHSLAHIPKGSRVGIVRENFFSSLLDEFKSIKKAFTHATPLLIKQLKYDRLDYVLEEFLPFMYYAKEEGFSSEFKEALIVQENNVCTAFSKPYFDGDTQAIADKASKVIKEMKTEGFIDKVIQKYIQ